jgi:hypothetical protein
MPLQPAPPLAAALAAAIERYEALSAPERQRVARLVMISGAPLTLAIAAVEATRRPAEEADRAA